jgi:Pretoxin HINT domain
VHIENEIIKTTSDHPFFVGGKWLRVVELHSGDSVTNYFGKKLAITSIEIIAKQTTVYNFEVEDYHSYYVSKQQVLVHNNGPCNLANNKSAGKALEEKVLKEKKAQYGSNYEVKAQQKSKILDRTHDISVYPKGSKNAIKHYEVKSGGSRYHSSQRIKDAIIEAKTGAKTEVIRR